MPDLDEGITFCFESERVRREMLDTFTERDQHFGQFEREKGRVQFFQSFIGQQDTESCRIGEIGGIFLNKLATLFQAQAAYLL